MKTRLLTALQTLAPVLVQAAKTAAAAGLAWFFAADLIGNNIPVFAPLAAVLTVQVTVWESVSRGLQRVLGVIVGVLVAYALARLARDPGLVSGAGCVRLVGGRASASVGAARCRPGPGQRVARPGAGRANHRLCPGPGGRHLSRGRRRHPRELGRRAARTRPARGSSGLERPGHGHWRPSSGTSPVPS